MPRKPSTSNPFVVYVTYEPGGKEYAYLCNIPGIVQGDQVLANNGKRVTVVRTAMSDPIATRFVTAIPEHDSVKQTERKKQICNRLREIEREEEFIARMTRLKSPEAKKLLAELKGL